MNADSPLYWGHIYVYEHCPQQFLWNWGWEGIDLGQGPGKPIKHTGPKGSRHNPVMGIVVGRAVEKFYNDQVYLSPARVTQILTDFVEKEWGRQTRREKNWIDYDRARMSAREMVADCKKGVEGFLVTMKKHRLLGNYAQAEVRMLGWLNKWVTIAGIADVVIRRDDTGITIIDGKNTVHKMKYTDADQLRWYALVFWREFGVMPDRLGFVWFKFPAGMKTTGPNGEEVVEEGIEWVPFDEGDLRGLAKRAIDARNAMRRKKFDPVPDPPQCKKCKFELMCPARKEQRERNADRRRPRNMKELKDEEGFSDFTL